jgi:hypothetical protein
VAETVLNNNYLLAGIAKIRSASIPGLPIRTTAC